jgi:hypothetical protein
MTSLSLTPTLTDYAESVRDVFTDVLASFAGVC